MKVMRILLALLGALLAVAGIVGAAYVGPDDTVVLDEHRVTAARGAPLVTVPSLFSYDDLRLTVRARSEGPVFLGAGEPVDVRDYVRDARVFEVTGINRDGSTRGARVNGEALPVAPERVGFWSEQAFGSGTQQLRLTGDEPFQLVVASQGRADAPVSLAVGATLPGLFWACLSVAAAGVLLLLVGLVWARLPVPVRVGAPLVSLALLVTGAVIVTVPSQRDYRSPTRPALRVADGEALVSDFAERRREARKRGFPPRLDATAWSRAFAGAALETQRVWTPLFRALPQSKPSIRRDFDTDDAWQRLEVLDMFEASTDAFPRYVVVALRTVPERKVGKADRRWARRNVELAVFTQRRSWQPWLMEAYVDVPNAQVPDVGEPAAPTDQVITRARRDFEALQTLWTDDAAAPRLKLGKDAREFARAERDLTREVDFIGRMEQVAYPHTGSSGSSDPWVVPTAGGWLAIGSARVEERVFAKPGMTVGFNQPYAAISGTEKSTNVTRNQLVTAALLIPRDSASRTQVIGTGWGLIED